MIYTYNNNTGSISSVPICYTSTSVLTTYCLTPDAETSKSQFTHKN